MLEQIALLSKLEVKILSMILIRVFVYFNFKASYEYFKIINCLCILKYSFLTIQFKSKKNLYGSLDNTYTFKFDNKSNWSYIKRTGVK